MSDKDFKVKNKLIVSGLNNASGVILATNNQLDSHTLVPTQYGGTGTTTSPNSGQILYSSAGTTYSPTALNTLDVKGSTYSADAPSSPAIGQIWVESDSTVDSFDPNIIRRQAFTATAGQTEFTTSIQFVEGYEQVYFNGLLLLRTTDYTTSNSNKVTLGAAAAADDIVEVVTVTNLNSVNTYTQSEINSTFAPKANPTFSGTVTGITKSMVGLANVDNTTDANKPVSTATQTALDLKANKGAFNYVQTLGTKVTGISGASTAIVSATITTNGYPVHIFVTGDAENGASGAWARLQLFRGSTAIGNIIHVEGSAGSENIPFALQFIDSQVAGTYTYSLRTLDTAGGTYNFGESNGPVITVLELGR